MTNRLKNSEKKNSTKYWNKKVITKAKVKTKVKPKTKNLQ
jgi:hypothetical protein